MKRVRVVVGFGLLAAIFATSRSANASLVFDDQLFITGAGLGTGAILTMQATGSEDEETGCTAWNGATVVGGTCSAIAELGDQTRTGAGQIEAPTLGDLAITDATQLVIVFDPNQIADGPITLSQLALELTRADGTVYYTALLAAPVVFPTTDPGVGSAGFSFVLDAAQAAAANLLGLLATDRIALEAEATGFNDGPESFFAANAGASVPDGGTTITLLGCALLGLGALRRKMKA